MLVKSTLDGEETIEQLPSPERLRGRILLKVSLSQSQSQILEQTSNKFSPP